ncbi:MAG: isoprenyl transferase [Deltaproteobacteria bacterium]|nr:isoprenyl transferase [Deltaproteobacteria bacterium]MBF0527012.1 isoprenyl transferase [Deltaproteobacteria bacterium]
MKSIANQNSIPVHLAIIMDGNGRWAKQRGLDRIAGHREGAESVRTIVRASREIGIKYLTLYALSIENWQRPKIEIKALMALLGRFLKSELDEMLSNGIRLNVIGRLDDLPKGIKRRLKQTMDQTAHNRDMVLNLSLSYGGRDEIVDAAKRISLRVKEGALTPEEITPEIFSAFLYTHGMPDPDLLIRTSGEYRVSNFLLWQIAYAELYFTTTLWPDFRREQLLAAIEDFQQRERRFGMTGEQVAIARKE